MPNLMLGSMIGTKLVKDVMASDCAGVDRIVENLAPRPAEHVAELIGAILILADDKKDQDSGLPMCRG